MTRDVADAGGLAGGVVVPVSKPVEPTKVAWEFVAAWAPDDPIGSTPPHPDWLLMRNAFDGRSEGVMRAGKVALLAAAGGAGKTALLCGLALSLSTGRRWLDTFEIPKPGPVLLALGEEDKDEIHRRLHWASRSLALSREQRDLAAARILALPLAGHSCALVENDGDGNVREAPFLLEMRDRLSSLGIEWRALILDPLARFAGVDTETSNAAATRFIQALETLIAAPGKPAVICAHHTTKSARKDGKSDQTSVRGASALVDGARWVGTLTKVMGHPHAVIYEIQKSNYGPWASPLVLMRERGGALRRASVAEEAEVTGKDDEL